MDKPHANKGVERNKKPLQNIVYRVKLSDPKGLHDALGYAQYKYKELGYLVLYWQFEKNLNKEPKCVNYHGFITPEELRNILGAKQWSKFAQGKREFIVQRRVDGKNIALVTRARTSKE